MNRDCPTCLGYALVEADVVAHEVQAGADFDDQYEVITALRHAHVARAHSERDTDISGLSGTFGTSVNR